MGDHIKSMFDSYGVEINQYNDFFDRYFVIEAAGQIYIVDSFDFNTKCGTDLKSLIDLLFYLEVENGRWYGDHQYSNKRDTFGLNYQSVNISERKFYMWGILARHLKWLARNDKIEEFKNIRTDFIRINKEYNQLFIIRDETIRNPDNYVRKNDQIVGNSTTKEDFICFSNEHYEEYNLQLNDRWFKSTHPNGSFDPRTAEIQKNKILEYGKIRINEVMKNRKKINV